MERKGGCCLAPRYGGAAAAHQAAGAAWQMGRIMLKFRPIAPKPAAMAPGTTPAPVVVAAGRGKRKAVGGGGGRRGRKPKKAVTVAAVAAAPPVPGNYCKDDDKHSDNGKPLPPSRSSSSSGMTSVDTSPPPPSQLATLALLPVPPPAEDEAAVDTVRAEEPPVSLVAALAAGAQSTNTRAMPPAAAAAAASCWVTVEEVTGTWRDGEAPSSAACVGSGAAAFVSDQWGRVAWRSSAFGRLVSADDGDDEEALVALTGALPAWGTCAGFTCRVRIRHSTPRPVGSSVVAPCDVSRLDAAGCYLWRLDLLAALTLGPAASRDMTP